MMNLRVTMGIIAVTLSASMVGAQQSPTPPPQSHRAAARAGAKAPMMMMDSLNRRLDSLVVRMNRTAGNQKVEAMAAVINELVGQRKAMQNHMHRMMDDKNGVMPMRDESASPATLKSTPKLTPGKNPTVPDTSGHAGHHPSK